MRKILIALAAAFVLAAVTLASARPFIGGGFHGFHHGWGGWGWGGPVVGFGIGAHAYAYASCPLVRVVHYGRVVRYVRECY